MLRPLAVLAVSLLAASGCQKSESQPAPAKATASKAAPTSASAKAGAAPTPAQPPKAEANFEMRIIPGEATAGQAGESVIEITPKPGYKMNLDFPSRLKLTEHAGLTPAKDTLAKDDAEVTEKAIKFKVSHTCDKAGQYKVSGLTDFSVCNDKACKLIRGEKVAWTVDVK